MKPTNEHLAKVWRYYDRTESRIGYQVLLGGTKHFGWYESGDRSYDFARALIRMEDQLGNQLGLPKDSSVLDAGCGTGAVARAMASRFQLNVTGIDILDFNLDAARSRSKKAQLDQKTKFTWGDYREIPFGSDDFDGVYTMETLVHSDDVDKVLGEFYRVLKPGGKLIMFEYSSTPLAKLSEISKKAFLKVCDIAAMPGWIELEDGILEAKLQHAGFINITSTDITNKMLPMLHWFAILGRFPYFVGRVIRKEQKTVNSMSGVEMYRHQEAWKYNIYTAQKPG